MTDGQTDGRTHGWTKVISIVPLRLRRLTKTPVYHATRLIKIVSDDIYTFFSVDPFVRHTILYQLDPK